jgi:hypothetical protein
MRSQDGKNASMSIFEQDILTKTTKRLKSHEKTDQVKSQDKGLVTMGQ